MTTMQQLETILGEYREFTPGTITPDTTFEALELDSLDVVDMAMACEDAFGITVELDENMRTIGDLLALIEAGK